MEICFKGDKDDKNFIWYVVKMWFGKVLNLWVVAKKGSWKLVWQKNEENIEGMLGVVNHLVAKIVVFHEMDCYFLFEFFNSKIIILSSMKNRSWCLLKKKKILFLYYFLIKAMKPRLDKAESGSSLDRGHRIKLVDPISFEVQVTKRYFKIQKESNRMLLEITKV